MGVKLPYHWPKNWVVAFRLRAFSALVGRKQPVLHTSYSLRAFNVGVQKRREIDENIEYSFKFGENHLLNHLINNILRRFIGSPPNIASY